MPFFKTPKAKILSACILALILIFWWIAYHSMDSLIASAIRKYGSEITGVIVKVSSVRLKATEGSLLIRGLSVGNPKGFKSDHAMSVGEIQIAIDIPSLTSNLIRIRRVNLVNPQISYESNSIGNNFEIIQKNTDRYLAETFGGGTSKAESSKKAGKKMIIDDLQINGATVEITSPYLAGQSVKMAVPPIHLRGIGQSSGGATAGVVVKQIIGSLTSVVGNVAGPVLSGALQGVKGGVNAIGGAIKGIFGR